MRIRTTRRTRANWSCRFHGLIDANHDGVCNTGELSTVSDSAGKFSFSNLSAGNYDVIVKARVVITRELARSVGVGRDGKTAYVGFGEVAI